MWYRLLFLVVAVVPCKSANLTRVARVQTLQSFACPFLSRHLEIWDELPDGRGFRTRFGDTFRRDLPSDCKVTQEAVGNRTKFEEVSPKSFLQGFLQVGSWASKGLRYKRRYAAPPFRPPLVPYPKSLSLLQESSESFVLSKGTSIELDSALSESTPFVALALSGLRKHLGEAVQGARENGPASVILLGMSSDVGGDPDSYKLTIQDGKMHLEARGPEGFSHGVTTIRQLIPLSVKPLGDVGKATSMAQVKSPQTLTAGVIPALVIEDAPAFKWRGLHLDVSRHFFPAADVMKLLSTMAEYKMNRFHWHLTDDQGWRFPVPGYPELTRKGAGPRFKGKKMMSSGEGIEGSYTEQDIRDVLDFAKNLHIKVIPEVDVPGHVAAAIAAYPNLGNPDFEPPAGPQHEFGVHKWTLAPTKASADFLEAVFSQIARLFTEAEYIHLGGDEAPQDQWRQSSESAKRNWEQFEGDNAQSYFNHKVSEIIRAKGKKMAGWDEVQSMQGLPQDAAIFAWRSEDELRKALQAGRQAVNAENGHLYLDHIQGPQHREPKAIGGPITTVREVYQYDPVPRWVRDEDRHLVLGGQGQLWSEYFPNWQQVEYMAWPRACALSERLWTPEEELSLPDFLTRMKTRVKDFQRWGVNFHPLEA